MREIVTLEVIGPRLSRLSVPTPRVLNYDVTSNKSLEGPFTLQTRLRGNSLAEIWDNLKPSQRRSAMQQIIQIIEKIASITAHAGGSISTENLEFPTLPASKSRNFSCPVDSIQLLSDSRSRRPIRRRVCQ
jgi:aminoglycoside phosphotransferase (APT) family kinase protein